MLTEPLKTRTWELHALPLHRPSTSIAAAAAEGGVLTKNQKKKLKRKLKKAALKAAEGGDPEAAKAAANESNASDDELASTSEVSSQQQERSTNGADQVSSRRGKSAFLSTNKRQHALKCYVCRRDRSEQPSVRSPYFGLATSQLSNCSFSNLPILPTSLTSTTSHASLVAAGYCI